MKNQKDKKSTSKKKGTAEKKRAQKNTTAKSKAAVRSKPSKSSRASVKSGPSEGDLKPADIKTEKDSSDSFSPVFGEAVSKKKSSGFAPDREADISDPLTNDSIREPSYKPAFNYAVPEQMKGSDFMKKALPYLIVGFIILIGFLLVFSLPNADKFYVKKTADGIKILQGTFSPIGKRVLVDLPGAPAPDPLKDVYTRNEANAMICSYFLKKAENVWNKSGQPDFEAYKTLVGKAMEFASTDALKKAVRAYQNDIKLMVLFYQADLAASKGTTSDIENAAAHIKQAASYDLDERQTKLVEYKTRTLNDLNMLIKLSE